MGACYSMKKKEENTETSPSTESGEWHWPEFDPKENIDRRDRAICDINQEMSLKWEIF